MKVFFVDETNIVSNADLDFCVYGGLVIDQADLRNLSIQVQEIKKKYEIKKERPIKWPNINWQKEGELDAVLHAKIKNELLDLIQKSNCKIIVCLIPQTFSHSRKSVGFEIREVFDRDKHITQQTYAINLYLEKYNEYLQESKDLGIVIIDSFEQGYKKELIKYCFEMFPGGTGRSTLNNIVYPVIEVDNEYSQIHQINDVILGAIAHSLKELSHNFLPIIRDNFWCKSSKDKWSIMGRGFNTYPVNPRMDWLKLSLMNINSKFLRLVGH